MGLSVKFLLTAGVVGLLGIGAVGALEGPAAAQIDLSQIGAIGFYSNGCLDSSSRVLEAQPGLVKLFVERERWFGDPSMVDLLQELGLAYDQEWREAPLGILGSDDETPIERIQLGDIAQRGGGRVTRHASHQTGLDVDIVYMRRDHRETLPNRGADASFDEIFVKSGKVTANLDLERQWWVWRWLNRTGKIDRIFVDPRIKKRFCEAADELEPGGSEAASLRTSILRMLRPYANHMDHFHMRLVCPHGDRKCVTQAPVPAGSGCSDRELGIGTSRTPIDEIDERRPPASALTGGLSATIEDLEDGDESEPAPDPTQTDTRHLPKECSEHGHFPEPHSIRGGDLPSKR